MPAAQTLARRARSAKGGAAPEAAITPALIKKHNLSDEEYQRIVKALGRTPTLTELGMFSVMWAEHCSYASSKVYLREFPTTGKRVLVPAGQENAGLIDIGHGWAVAFKVESHNHPSAVEPHAGAATGVGGIIRDIFTMGARPIALLDSLRFGGLDEPRTRFLFEGVVKGIADYGNAVGVPTVGGEIYFDEAYRDNPLVNVMCIGVLRHEQLARAAARGSGNPVVYVGSSTGRDGLGGASFASREITEGSEADRPAVQIGDPFAEKCLIEATLEALAGGDVVGIQDMGAAGLTCSTCETASRGKTGIEIDVAKVPRREALMSPYEVMLSESQERMLLIVKRGRADAVKRIFAKWDLHAAQIGQVTSDGLVRIKEAGRTVAQIPARALTDEAPVYRRPTRRPAYLAKAQRLNLERLSPPRELTEALLSLLASPTIADKSAVYERYDHMVQTGTVVLPGRGDAAVLRIRPTGEWLAATLDGNGTYAYLDPYEGGKLAVAEAARNLACVGATPLAVTDCLNFGNPEDPEVMWQFAQAVRGITEACRALGTPVTGGNVSFYNEGPRGAIDPTPVIGMIGLVQVRGSGFGVQGKSSCPQPPTPNPQPLTMAFKDEGDRVILLGDASRAELGGSEYLKRIHRRKQGRPPTVDLAAERRLISLLGQAHRGGLLKSAHDCAEGGLAVAAAECCVADPERMLGATVSVAEIAGLGSGSNARRPARRPDALLFGESAGRVIASCAPYDAAALLKLAQRSQVPARLLGEVGGGLLTVHPWVEAPVKEIDRAWRNRSAGC
ncbi:MAG: phosphoribosylformylglycinamidine synthase subunit PurL [Candidatus Omnitrophica bacterium]|nr:phosphoribosylformylglycinamidine synthase subunit PurL [Candidatus Omnitrophota bacterium]